MSDELRFYALFGAGTALSLRMSRDGKYMFAIQGNVEPLFPPMEMGTYAGQDAAAVGRVFQLADQVLPACQSNARTQPGAAFVSVQDGDQGWSFDLYAPPAAFVPLQQAVFNWVNGDARRGKLATVTAKASFTEKQVRARDKVRFELTLASTGTQDVTVSTPRGETVRLVLADAAPEADEESYFMLTHDELRVFLTPASIGDALMLKPGAHSVAVVEVDKPVMPGQYRGTLTYLSQEADADVTRRAAMRGELWLELGTVRVLPTE